MTSTAIMLRLLTKGLLYYLDNNMKATQLNIFGMSADEKYFTSTLWGVLTFFPARSNKWTDTCRHCLLWDNEAGHCSEPPGSARCADYERNDRKEGYFSIQHIPQV